MLLFDVKILLIHRSMIPCLREFVAYAGFYSRFIFFEIPLESSSKTNALGNIVEYRFSLAIGS